MKIELIEKLTFEKGDLFFVVEDQGGSTYRNGDFLLIKEKAPNKDYFAVESPRTVNGSCRYASFTAQGLEEQVKAGIFVYQGNVKK